MFIYILLCVCVCVYVCVCVFVCVCVCLCVYADLYIHIHTYTSTLMLSSGERRAIRHWERLMMPVQQMLRHARRNGPQVRICICLLALPVRKYQY